VKIALYPGSFDPITYGHLDTARRAARIFDRVVMAVFDRPNRKLLFSTEERLALLHEATASIAGLQIETYTGLTVGFARQVGAQAIVRGIRSGSDYEQEFQMAQINRTIEPDIDVLVMLASHQYSFLSASMVREVAALGGDVSAWVPPHVVQALDRKFGRA
jgi:pantetheine-phosphate adenylyltransferase